MLQTLKAGSILSRPTIIRARTNDGLMTYDARTIDSTGAFLITQGRRRPTLRTAPEPLLVRKTHPGRRFRLATRTDRGERASCSAASSPGTRVFRPQSA